MLICGERETKGLPEL